MGFRIKHLFAFGIALMLVLAMTLSDIVNNVAAEVLLIRSGTARLLWQDGGVLKTAEKLGPGSFVGLASLLRAELDPAMSGAPSTPAIANRIMAIYWRLVTRWL